MNIKHEILGDPVMRKSISSAAAAILVATVLASGSAFAAGGKDKDSKSKGDPKKTLLKTGTEMEGQKGGNKVELNVPGLKRPISNIPAEDVGEYEMAAKDVNLKALGKLLEEDQRSILKGKIAKDTLSEELVAESLIAVEKDFENANLMSSIAARAAGREDGFTDKEAANVLKFVRAFNGAKNSKTAMVDAAKTQLGDKATESEINEKIRQILEACKDKK